jgi:hypothetical protein
MDTIRGYFSGSSDTRRALHWDIESAARNLAWVRGASVSVGRSIVGAGYSFKKVEDYEKEATDEALQTLKMFYGPGGAGNGFKRYKNFKDFYTLSGKFYAIAVSMATFGFGALEIKRDKLNGKAVDFDYIPGYVEPNTDTNGDFLKPAFKQYLSQDGLEVASWDDASDLVFIANPDFSGYPFSPVLEALISYALPSDVYAALSWLSMHKNRNAPLDGYWEADPNMADADFRKLVAVLQGRHTGASNYGRAPIIAKGNLKFNRIQRSPEEAPYEKGREFVREEIGAVTGVHPSKLGDGTYNKEDKKDYYEVVVETTQKALEEALYEQVHIREFGIRGWTISFNNPSFLTEVEEASKHRTYWNTGVLNANEIRAELGKKPREGGDKYFEPANMIKEPGKQDEIPAQGGDPGTDPALLPPAESDPVGEKPRPVRTDEQSIQEELRKWKTVAVKRAKQGKPVKEFESETIPEGIKAIIEKAVTICWDNPEKIKEIFKLIEENYDGTD